jgi:EAL domain-containing protein (putative c-di-GMP-specific phosphodiesterase class I)
MRILRELGCEFGQGHFFSKPLDASAATELLVTEGALSEAL